MAQKSLSGKTKLFAQRQNVSEKYSTFTIWNLNKNVFGEKSGFLRQWAHPLALPWKAHTSPNGKSITPVLELPRPIVHVAVNELYPPFVYKINPTGEGECVGCLVPCYQTEGVNTSGALVEEMFCCVGASLDFLEFLQKDLNFEVRIYLNLDGQYGIFNDNTGKWNGIVQELVEGRAMLSLEMGLNTRRAAVISFAHPTLLLELGIFVNKADMRKDSISYAGGVAFGKNIGAERTPLSTSSRLVSYVYSLLALIVINNYCANLMAFLLQENDALPISGIDDPKLISDPPMFQVAAVRGSNEEDYFKHHVNSSFRKIYDKNLRENSMQSLEKGVEHIRQGKIQGLIGDYLSLSQIANRQKLQFQINKTSLP